MQKVSLQISQDPDSLENSKSRNKKKIIGIFATMCATNFYIFAWFTTSSCAKVGRERNTTRNDVF